MCQTLWVPHATFSFWDNLLESCYFIPQIPELEGRWGFSDCSTASSPFSPCLVSGTHNSGTRYPSSELKSVPVTAHLAWASIEMLVPSSPNRPVSETQACWFIGKTHTRTTLKNMHELVRQTCGLWLPHCILKYTRRYRVSSSHVPNGW